MHALTKPAAFPLDGVAPIVVVQAWIDRHGFLGSPPLLLACTPLLEEQQLAAALPRGQGHKGQCVCDDNGEDGAANEHGHLRNAVKAGVVLLTILNITWALTLVECNYGVISLI